MYIYIYIHIRIVTMIELIVTGSAEFSGACNAPGQQIPDLCALPGLELIYLQLYYIYIYIYV